MESNVNVGGNPEIEWPLTTGPASLVNYFLSQAVVDADGGPGEIVVRLGYVLPPPIPTTAQLSGQGSKLQITNVAAFSLTRARAAELAEYLRQQVENWDLADEAARGVREKQ